jgi:hypothetical protein
MKQISFLGEWPFWVMIGLFLATITLAIVDPFNLDPNGIESTSAIKALYFIPAVFVWFFVFVKPMYSTKSLSEQKEINTEQFKSIIRTVIQVIGSLIAIDGVFNLNIPFLEIVLNLASYLGENIDIAANAIMALIGFVTAIYGFFIDKGRFEKRTTGGVRLK